LKQCAYVLLLLIVPWLANATLHWSPSLRVSSVLV